MRNDLRKAARGRECQYRGPTCNHNPETVVLCHIRKSGTGGMGMKPPDICGFWGCNACHDFYDARVEVEGYTTIDRDRFALGALLRTLVALDREELI